MTKKFGVKLPNGITSGDVAALESLFEMTTATIVDNKLFQGFTIKLERSALGEWLYSIEGK